MAASLTHNAFHVLGLTGTASAREIVRQSNVIVQRLKIDEVPEYELDIFDPKDFRTQEAVKDALRRLQAPKTRVREYFFWYRISDDLDKQAGSFLAERDFDHAIDTWKQSGEGAGSVAAATHSRNLALAQTVSLVYNPTNTSLLEKSLSDWSDLLNSPEFWSVFSESYRIDAELASDEAIADLRREVARDLSDIYAELQEIHPNGGFVPAFQRVFDAKGDRIDRTILNPIFERINSQTETLDGFKIDATRAREVRFSGMKEPLSAIQTELNELIDSGLYESTDARVVRDRVANVIRVKTISIHNDCNDFNTASLLLEFAIEISGTDGLKALLKADHEKIRENLLADRENTLVIRVPGSRGGDPVVVKPDHLRRGETTIYFKDATVLTFHSTRRSVNGIPKSVDYAFFLQSAAASVNLHWTAGVLDKDSEDAWGKMVNIGANLAAPHIVERYVRLIFSEMQTVTIGKVEFTRDGCSRRKLFGGRDNVFWKDKIWIPELRAGNVVIWKDKNGKGLPFSTVPMSTTNAVVIPELVQACVKAAIHDNR